MVSQYEVNLDVGQRRCGRGLASRTDRDALNSSDSHQVFWPPWSS